MKPTTINAAEQLTEFGEELGTRVSGTAFPASIGGQVPGSERKSLQRQCEVLNE